MAAENALYMKASALVEFLRKWQGAGDSLPSRMEELAIEMYERDYLGTRDGDELDVTQMQVGNPYQLHRCRCAWRYHSLRSFGSVRCWRPAISSPR